jgi:hypothetical protein
LTNGTNQAPLPIRLKREKKGVKHSTDECLHYDIVSFPNCYAFLYKHVRSRQLLVFLLVL